MANALEPEALPDDFGRDLRHIYRIGSDAARERIWMQFDSCGAGMSAVAGAWVAVDWLASTRASRYRQLLLARAQVAVVTPGRVRRDSALQPEAVPILDAGVGGGSAATLAAMNAFQPTIVVHIQDWSAPAASAMSARGAQHASGSGRRSGAAGGMVSGVRLVESFHIEPEWHRQLAVRPPGRTWTGRPNRQTHQLAAHPDGRLGAQAARLMARSGFDLVDGPSGVTPASAPGAASVIRMSRGRYVPRLEWRGLGGGSLCELALLRHGAIGMCGQVFGSDILECTRAGLSLAEGVIIYRLNLETGEEAA